MAFNSGKAVVDYLTVHPDEGFSIQQMLPEAEWQGTRHGDKEPEDDTYDRFIRSGHYPVRQLMVARS